MQITSCCDFFFFDLLLHCWDWGEAGEAAKVKNTKEVLLLSRALKLHALLSSPSPAARWGGGGVASHGIRLFLGSREVWRQVHFLT